MTATYTTQIVQAGDDGLFEQVDADGTMRCTVCGTIGAIDGQDVPSMYTGTETSLTCRACGSTEAVSDPFKGTRRVTRRDNLPGQTPAAKLIAQTPDGPVREGDFVRYHGSIIGLYGQILEAVRYSPVDGLVLRTCTGGTVKRVRTTSISPS